MPETQRYKTRSFIRNVENPGVKGYCPVAVDIGYSSVKVFTEKTIACIPSFLRTVPRDSDNTFLADIPDDLILYRDETGEYIVGVEASKDINDRTADSKAGNLYIKDRYLTHEYIILFRIALSLASVDGGANTPTLSIMTGLPSTYLASDSENMKIALSGSHVFDVRYGKGQWQHHELSVTPEDISVIQQPLGSLISMVTDHNGGRRPGWKDYFTKNVLVLDPGFGTIDTFDIRGGRVCDNQTWANLGMHSLLELFSQEIRQKYGEDIPVYAMQEVLERGTIKNIDRINRTVTNIEISDIFEKCDRAVCSEALRAVDSHYGGLTTYDYLLVTGGLGYAWRHRIRDYFGNIETLSIIDEIVPSGISPIMGNVRGYYMHQIVTLKLTH